MKVRCNPANLERYSKCLPTVDLEPDEAVKQGTARNEAGELVIASFGGALGPTDPTKWRYLHCTCDQKEGR